jgi:hypothetical protein
MGGRFIAEGGGAYVFLSPRLQKFPRIGHRICSFAFRISRELGHVALWSRAIIFKRRHYHGIVAHVKATNQSGGLKQVNAQYKRYRQAQVAKAEKASPYSLFLERITATIVRDVAMSWRMI